MHCAVNEQLLAQMKGDTCLVPTPAWGRTAAILRVPRLDKIRGCAIRIRFVRHRQSGAAQFAGPATCIARKQDKMGAALQRMLEEEPAVRSLLH